MTGTQPAERQRTIGLGGATSTSAVRPGSLTSIPILGRIIPVMGTKTDTLATSALLDPFLGAVQQRLLGLLFGQPDRAFQSADLIRAVRSGTGAVHRQLQQLADAGLITVIRRGNHKFYQANRTAPIFAELHGLALKTTGLVGPLRQALHPLEKAISAAFVYGSVAREPTARPATST